jgi:hypothetical protein
LAANPDVREAGIDPLLHYLQYGEAERRVLPQENAAASSALLDDFQVLPHP